MGTNPDDMGVKNARLIREALLIMRKHENFTYVIDSVMACEYFRLNYPDMWDELKQRVKENRVELAGGHIIAPDTLMPSGEALVRQFLYGQRYFKKHFNVTSKAGYLLDSFGQTPQLPQIMKKADLEYFIFVRGARNRNLPEEFLWKSPDGSKILTHWMYSTYTYLFPPFNPTILPPNYPFFPIPGSLQFVPQTFKIYELICKLFPPFKYFFRWYSNINFGISLMGADLGGLKKTIKSRTPRSTTNNLFILNGTDNLPPSTSTLDAVDYYNKKSKENHVKMALPSDFIAAVKKERKKFAIIENYEFLGTPDLFPGTWNNRPKLKQTIRTLENQFYLTELMSTLARLHSDFTYPNEEIEKAIIRILRCDFHDGICGCCIDAAFNHMMKQLKLTELQLKRIYNSALNAFVKEINTSKVENKSTPLFILNPLVWSRSETVSVELQNGLKDVTILDSKGSEIPHQIDKINENSVVFTIRDIPPASYSIYSIKEKSSAIEREKSPETDQSLTIENNLLKLTFQEGKLITILNKKDNFEINANNEYSLGDLRIHNDRGDSYFSGHVGKTYGMYDQKIEVIEGGSVRTVIKQTAKLRCKNKFLFKPVNAITQYIIVPNTGEPHIDFITKFHNNIRNVRVQACFPIQIESPTIRSEIPYGFYERDILPKFGKSWRESNKRFEHYDRLKPAINWMDYSSVKEKKGVTIINNGMPEYEIGINKDICYLTLFRSTGLVGNLLPYAVPWIAAPFYRMPKGYALEDQAFCYSLYLHNGDFSSNAIAKMAQSHNIPPIAHIINQSSGKLASNGSLFSADGENFMVTTIKMPEDGNSGIIIRLYETSGKKSKGKLNFNQKLKSVKATNLLEIPFKDLTIENERSFSFTSNPQEILTFLIEL